MATITLTLSARKSKDTGKAEILLRYRNTREVALRAHTRVFILPKYFVDGQIVIKNRLITPEVKEAQEAKALIERIINHLTEKGNNKAISDFTQDWAQDTIDRLLFPQNYSRAYSKAVQIGAAREVVDEMINLKDDYEAVHGAVTEAAPKVFLKYFYVNTKTGEKSGEMLATVKLV